ncbi:MAG: hypothetical protein ACTSRE_15305 [Promethearchaeota archaeon]
MSERSEKIQKFRKRMDALAERMYGNGRKYLTNTRQNGGPGILDGLGALHLAWFVIAIIIAIVTGGSVILL